jgi:hypothetical protein
MTSTSRPGPGRPAYREPFGLPGLPIPNEAGCGYRKGIRDLHSLSSHLRPAPALSPADGLRALFLRRPLLVHCHNNLFATNPAH